MIKRSFILMFLGLTNILGAVDSNLQKANRLLEEGLFQDAIPIYRDLLTRAPEDKKVCSRLTQALYQAEKFEEVIALLARQTLQIDNLLMLAACYIQTNQSRQAIPLLQGYLVSSPEDFLQAQFELAKAYFNENQFELAKSGFERFSPQDGPFYPASQVYLARLNLLIQEDAQAEKLLNEIASSVKLGNPLEYEIAFLKGLIRFRAEDFAKAASYFEKALPQRNAEKAVWYVDTLYYLGWSYLKMGDDNLLPTPVQKEFLNKSENAFLKMAAAANDERVQLSLGQYYLVRAARLDDKGAYNQAEIFLASSKGEAHDLLIKAQGASTYQERAKLYKQLTTESPNTLSGWYLRALNEFEEGQTHLAEGHTEEAKFHFENAAGLFRDAYERLKLVDPARAGLTLVYLSKSLDHQQKTKAALEVLTHVSTTLLSQMGEPDEVFFLKGFFAAKLTDTKLAEHYLAELLKVYPNGRFGEEALNLLGILTYQQERYAEAETYFKKLSEEYPDSYLTGDALALAANACDCLKQHNLAKNYRQKCYEHYAGCSLAPEAYFNYYTYREYLQGDRLALKHLNAFMELFPESHYLLNAHYLIGLDQTRERKTPEGKTIRKKNLTAAIDAFQEVENLYESLVEKKKIPADRFAYYTTLRYRSTLERAQNNLAIADEAIGAKKAIYLEYAEEVLTQMLENISREPQFQNEPYPPLEEEGQYWLAQTYLKQEDDAEAKKVLDSMLDKYRLAKTTRGYFLSRAWYDLASIAMRQKNYGTALQAFVHAEDASKGKVLSTDQKLDLWIQQSLSYQGLNELDQALLILSKVVNDDAVSSLRLKAMYLRAELYEKQERPELARKQLEAIAKKGGEWAKKAQDKLDKEYGYQ